MVQLEKISEEQNLHYGDALVSFEELIAELSGADVAAGTLGDAETVIQQRDMDVMRKLLEGYLNERSSSEEKRRVSKTVTNSCPVFSSRFSSHYSYVLYPGRFREIAPRFHTSGQGIWLLHNRL